MEYFFFILNFWLCKNLTAKYVIDVRHEKHVCIDFNLSYQLFVLHSNWAQIYSYNLQWKINWILCIAYIVENSNFVFRIVWYDKYTCVKPAIMRFSLINHRHSVQLIKHLPTKIFGKNLYIWMTFENKFPISWLTKTTIFIWNKWMDENERAT